MKYGLFLLDDAAVGTGERRHVRRPSKAAETSAPWRQYARRSLGTPFPASTPVTTKALDDQGERYRELAQKARLRLAALSADRSQTARATACQAYARPIQRELEETRVFLSKLCIDKPKASKNSTDADKSIADTLTTVERMRCKFKEEQEQKQQAKEAAAKQAEQAKQAKQPPEPAQAPIAPTPATLTPKPAQTASALTPSTLTPAPSTSAPAAQASATATKYRDMYTKLMAELAPKIRGDPAKRSYCFKQRGLVTRGVGQLKDSWEFISRTADNIKAILRDAGTKGDDVLEWMLNLVAKAIVKQAEREVAVAHHAAYPLASTAVLVMQTHPRLADMLMVRLVKKCPFAVPEYVAKRSGQSTDEYLKRAGYKRNDDDELESEGIYSERMAGMLALFAAIVQTPDIGGQPNPFPVHHGWTWLARMLNQKPRAISPMLVQTFLSVAGSTMLTAYARQMDKLLGVLGSAWLAAVPTSSPLAVAGKSNLTTFIEEYQQTGSLRRCKSG
ncbi:Nuclear pore complex nucleoporin component [Coemansia sp. RSA 2611]|nr:Nuclear pore complex nucleoporin component [Coemansia sp. RSA 2705]KAJ2321631.1 Nuclear pore complex nucleoporin component [Coemansia sp. RSA 2704]KAJ2369498.1 Nuclear pore complex nucleoporin component [Coemansia sp. RSA 2610]KAJ2392635.1 Nuclear pore complex nucleoporin component [Coemansia sp. RSA 2611]KAJ2739285.1 Nuclear pore complex nucleoporin component [Coemansia sp. Cherry 401B]